MGQEDERKVQLMAKKRDTEAALLKGFGVCAFVLLALIVLVVKVWVFRS